MSRSTLVLDLDNTIYPESWGLMDVISNRMVQFVRTRFQGDEVEVRGLIERYRSRFNSIAIGFMNDRRAEFDDFLRYSHEIDLSSYTPDASLGDLLELSGFRRKFIFSNAPRVHVVNVLRKFELTGAFDDIVCIEDVGYRYKPSAAAFDAFYAITKSDPCDSVFVDDCVRNIEAARTRGSHTVHVSEALDAGARSDEMHGSLAEYLLSRCKGRKE
ncbi:HAD-IA family hydrolase [Burkholderia cenocepacia]|uniref:HAD-IA family hydrolase n=1 Tax=Burkholderia cenocepacia TaxID=95486 RepID=UPI002AB0FAB5|nr:HAD-IA family hydrolase [Burkholderia cenocepacia]